VSHWLRSWEHPEPRTEASERDVPSAVSGRPVRWHRGCCIRRQLRSVATLEGRQTSHPLDGGPYFGSRSPCTVACDFRCGARCPVGV